MFTYLSLGIAALFWCRSRDAGDNRQQLLETFCTDRLLSDRLRTDCFAELWRMHQDAKVIATLAGTRSEDETRQFLNRELQHRERHGFGLWVYRDKADSRFVGRGGLR